jgi:hypothetical protein
MADLRDGAFDDTMEFTLKRKKQDNTAAKDDLEDVTIKGPCRHGQQQLSILANDNPSVEKHMQSIGAALLTVAGSAKKRRRVYFWDFKRWLEDSQDWYPCPQHGGKRQHLDDMLSFAQQFVGCGRIVTQMGTRCPISLQE